MVVKTTKRFDREIEKLPAYLRDKVILWVEFVETLGLREVRKRPGFHDEPLKGERKGQRSVRLNQSYRLIYLELREEKEILISEVSRHEY